MKLSLSLCSDVGSPTRELPACGGWDGLFQLAKTFCYFHKRGHLRHAQRLTTLATEHSTAFQPEVPVSNTSSSSPALLPLSICFSYFLLRYILTIRLPIGLYSCRHYLSHNPCRAGSPTGPISPWASGEGPLHLECTRRVRRDHHHHATLATRIVAFPAPAASALRQQHVRL